MMFQDRICSNMIELTLVVFVSRAARSRPVRVGASSLLALLFPSSLIEEGVYTHFSVNAKSRSVKATEEPRETSAACRVFLFFENAKNWSRSDDAKRRKKWG